MRSDDTCIDADAAIALAAGNCDPQQGSRLRRHMESCAGCRVAVAAAAALAQPVGAEEDSRDTTSGMPTAAPASMVGEIFDQRYRVEQLLGSGGMGTVFAAYDRQLHRRVALKLIRDREGALSDRLSRQLVAESRAMARLRHPNVVAVYDAGTEHDRTYVVMELVEGSTLRHWYCGQQHDFSERLARCLEAGRGLAAAHEVGLVHRDFKPDNVLVGTDGRAQVTDFGLARPSTQTRPEPVAVTELERQGAASTFRVVGTPRYMAPEQKQGHDVDRRADIYSYCATLEEIFEDAPAWMRRLVARGLRDDPADRYDHLQELLDALERASRPRRWPKIVGGLALLTIGGSAWVALRTAPPCNASMGVVWSESRRDELRTAMLATDAPYAQHLTRTTLLALDQYAVDWASSVERACEASRIDDALDSDDVQTLQHACFDRAQARFGTVVEVIEQDTDIEDAHLVVAELLPIEKCEDIPLLRDRDFFEPKSEAEAAKVHEVRTLLDGAIVNQAAHRLEDAHGLLNTARASADTLHSPVLQAEVASVDARLDWTQGRLDRAEEKLRIALALALEAGDLRQVQQTSARLMFLVGAVQGRFDEALRYREFAEELLDADSHGQIYLLRAFGHVYRKAGRPEEALQYLQSALELERARTGENSLAVATLYNDIAGVIHRSDPTRGLEVAQRVLEIRTHHLGPDHPGAMGAAANVASAMMEMGRYTEATAILEAQLERPRRTTGDIREVMLAHNLGYSLVQQRRCEEAEAHVRYALELMQRLVEGPGLHEAVLHNEMGNVWLCQNRWLAAEQEYQRALEIRIAILGSEHPDVGQVYDNLARTAFNQEQWPKAERLHRLSLHIRLEALGARHPAVAGTRRSLGLTLMRLGRPAEGLTQLRESVDIYEEKVGASHSDALVARVRLAEVLHEFGEHAEALAVATDVWTYRSAPDTPPLHRATAAFVLAQLLWQLGDETQKTEARRLAEIAVEDYRSSGDQRGLARAQAWLSEGARVKKNGPAPP